MTAGLTEDELFVRWRARGDRGAREELVRRHLPLARSLALRYRHTSEPLDDLSQVASIGLIKAIDRFDPDRGVKLKSFAVPTILGELKRHFRDKGAAVHLPRGLQELVLQIQVAEAKLSSETGRSPTVVEVAQYLEVELEQVVDAFEAIAALYAVSLDAPLDREIGEPITRHERIGTDDDGYPLVETAITLGQAIRQLPDADRGVLKLRFDQGLTQRQIGARIGVSQMQVSRILRRITEELRDAVDDGDAIAEAEACRGPLRAAVG
jgi:RNA polymerase sigma-B factor